MEAGIITATLRCSVKYESWDTHSWSSSAGLPGDSPSSFSHFSPSLWRLPFLFNFSFFRLHSGDFLHFPFSAFSVAFSLPSTFFICLPPFLPSCPNGRFTFQQPDWFPNFSRQPKIDYTVRYSFTHIPFPGIRLWLLDCRRWEGYVFPETSVTDYETTPLYIPEE